MPAVIRVYGETMNNLQDFVVVLLRLLVASLLLPARFYIRILLGSRARCTIA